MIAPVQPSHLRRKLGQVRTPLPIARWMTRWATAQQPRRILEPAVGDGVFIAAIAELSDGTPWLPHIEAFDIDEHQLSLLRRKLSSGAAIKASCRHKDFVSASITGFFDSIIANPPYVRHHSLHYPEQIWRRFDRQCGQRLSRTTNLYGLFMLRIWSLLAPAGRAALITPAEWLNADFGKQLKRYLLRENAIDALVHFHPSSQVFDDALTTAVITLLRKGREPNEPLRLVDVNNANDLQARTLKAGILVSPSELVPEKKWTPMFYNSASKARAASTTLGEIARCRRGIATGANDYFTLRRSQCLRWQLADDDLTVCVTKAAQLASGKLTRNEVGDWIARDQRVFLLKPQTDSAALRRYLAHGQELGIDRRFLPSHRPLWYMPEERPPAPILIGVFSRGDFRVVLNEAGVLNLTAYHGIYPRAKSASSIQKLFAYLVSRKGSTAIASQRRIYGGGLFKLEPRDVESVEVPATLA